MRQAQIRYTSGGFSFSIENPETTVTETRTGGVTAPGGRIVSSDGFVPDVTFKYTGKSDNLTWQASALLRQLAYDVPVKPAMMKQPLVMVLALALNTPSAWTTFVRQSPPVLA